MTPIDPYWGIIEFGTALALILYFGKLGLSILKLRVDSKVKQLKIQASQKAPFQGLTAVIENHETILGELYKLRDDQLSSGVKPEQMKGLVDRIKQVEWVKSNSSWLQYVAPHADRLIDLGLKTVERVLKVASS